MSGRSMLRLLVMAAVAAACSPVTPSVTPSPGPTATPGASPDDAATYRRIAAQVVAIRGLDAPSHVEPTIIDRATLEQNLSAEFDKDNPPAQIAEGEAIEKALGLIPAGASLRDLTVKLQGSQVIGYYDPKSKQLFVVSHDGGLGPTERLTYAHEFTHELQDGRFNLTGFGLDKLHDDSDRALAILSLVEGDAVGVQTAWMVANLSPLELAKVATEVSDPTMLAILASMPPIMRETSLFPYQNGAAFVANLRATGGYAAVNTAFGRPPASTEQILHPEKYTAGEGPVAVVLPDDLAARFGNAWTEFATDTMGELQTRVWLKGGGVAGDVARAAAAGWGGDRMILVKGPDASSVLVFESAWDTQADANAFRAAAGTAMTGLGLDGAVAASGVTVVVGIRSGTAPAGATLDLILRGIANPAIP